MIEIAPMKLEDIEQVLEIDRVSFPIPWSFNSYRNELLGNEHAHFFVALQKQPWHWRQLFGQKPQRRIVGYIGYWLIIDEAHISTIAVQPRWRGQGIGTLLLRSALHHAQKLHAVLATLEVRVSNEPAQKMYRTFGFIEVGRRAKYYRDNDEDALLMTLESLQAFT